MSDTGSPPEVSASRLSAYSGTEIAHFLLLALALLYTLYFARSLLMPLVVALLLTLLLSPLVNALKRFHIPRSISAILLLACIGGPLGLLGTQLAEPAEKWVKRLPELGMQLSEELDSLTESLAPQQEPVPPPVESKSGFKFFGWFGDDEAESAAQAPPQEPGNAVSDKLLQSSLELAVSVVSAAPFVIVQLLTVILLVLFQLIFGQRLWDTAIEIFPRVRDKRQARLVVARVQQELSRYILTVSLINSGLGLLTAGVLWLLGVEDALLWGVMVGLLNFAPYVGPLVSLCILSIAGLVQYGWMMAALVPALVYFVINLLEAQIVTPLVLGRNMRLNPLVLVVWLTVWGWLWGAAGVLLAVPLLVCLKLAAQELNVLQYWVRLIETRA